MRLLYLDVERFPIQRQLIEKPALAGKPIAFVQAAQGQQKIIVASSSAMAAGARPGMSLQPILRRPP